MVNPVRQARDEERARWRPMAQSWVVVSSVESPMSRQKLPIGIQTFREIRESNCYYVDKTRYALSLTQDGKAYFLSRPRRFGKSLFLETLKELFEGNEALFTGLAIHPQWDWSVKYPVLRFSFGAGAFNESTGLQNTLHAQLTTFEQTYDLPCQFADAPSS